MRFFVAAPAPAAPDVDDPLDGATVRAPAAPDVDDPLDGATVRSPGDAFSAGGSAAAPPPASRRGAVLAPRIAVLGAPADVRAVAWAVASRLGAEGERAAGIVATWSACPDEPSRPPRSGMTIRGRARATRAAAALSDGGHAARAAGRLVDVRLVDGPGAVAEAERVQDAAEEGPVILALAGARGPEWDGMLRSQDLVLLAMGPQVPDALASVALAATRDVCPGVPALAVEVAGGRRPRPSRHDLAAAVTALGAR